MEGVDKELHAILTSALDGGERPAAPQGKEHPVHIGYEGGWAPEPVCRRSRKEETPTPAGNRSPVV
jgi:hypothetical protein